MTRLAPAAGLIDVLPAAAAALGVPITGRGHWPEAGPAGLGAPDLGAGAPDLGAGPPDLGLGAPDLGLGAADRVVVVLVDGLGDELLARRGGHAPFLRAARRQAPSQALTCGFPTTTATSMGTFGTGLPPGAHGLVGLDIRDPERDAFFSELAWDPAVDPRRWQPHRTVFEQAAAAGVAVTRIGPGYFDGSGLTEAALRGGRFAAAESLEDRVAAAARAVRQAPRALVYLYWGELDKVGHVHGCDSWQWGEQLTTVDGAVRELAERLPAGTLLLITADHGMVDVPFPDRVDVAGEPDLAAGVRFVGGEGRAVQLYCRPGAAGDVLAAWRERLGSVMTVRSREQAVAEGWFGPVEERVLPRIGEVLAVAEGSIAVVDSRTARPEVLKLIGLHGAPTEAEQRVPLIAVRA